MTEQKALRTDPVWRRFFGAHAVSVTGTSITLVVLPIALFQRTGSAGWTALLTALQTIPYLLFGLLAGVLADRRNRRRIMIISDLAAAAIVASVPVADAFGVLTTPQLVLVALGVATCFVWFDAANFGALPALFGRAHVVNATSALATFDSIALIAGPAIGAVLATTATPSIALILDGVSYVASALLIGGIHRSFALARASDAPEHGTLRAGIAEGLSYLWNHRVIRALTFSGFGNSVSFGALLGLTVPYAVEQLGLSDHDPRIGLLLAVGAIGSLTAALVIRRLDGGQPRPRWSTYGMFATAIAMFAIGQLTTLAIAVAVWVVWQASFELAILNGITYRQRTIPDEYLGRVNVVARMIAWGGQPFGAAIGGALATVFDVRIAITVMVVPVTVAAFTTARTLLSAP